MSMFNPLNLFKGRPGIIPAQRLPMGVMYSVRYAEESFEDEISFIGSQVEWNIVEPGQYSMSCAGLFANGKVHPVVTGLGDTAAYCRILDDNTLVINLFNSIGVKTESEFMLSLLYRR